MASEAYTLFKISRKLYNKDFNDLTSEQKSKVLDIYYY